MTKALVKRIDTAFGLVYDMGDSGLDYMDGHVALDANLMQHLYDQTLDKLTKAELKTLALQLESVVADMAFDLE